jgi:hypothetical protein
MNGEDENEQAQNDQYAADAPALEQNVGVAKDSLPHIGIEAQDRVALKNERAA